MLNIKDFDYNKVNSRIFGTKKAQDQDYDPNKAEKENSKKGGAEKEPVPQAWEQKCYLQEIKTSPNERKYFKSQ